MKRTILCEGKDIPFGCTIVDDVFSETGALLCKGNSVVNKHIRSLLKNYGGKVKITLTEKDQLMMIKEKYDLSDEILEHITPDEIKEEHSFDMSDDVKTEALNSMKAIYNTDNVDRIANTATELGDKILENIESSDSITINLSKLKVSDEYTYKHSIDVATMGVLVARDLGYDEEFQKDIIVSGILHDLGKTQTPKEVLNKHRRLTKEEFEYIQAHPKNGYDMIKDIPDISEETKQGVLRHHESYDGNGYPGTLIGTSIPIIARILTVVDVYDALVTDRPYRLAMKPADALEVMFTMSSKFDPVVFRSFMNIIVAYPIGSVVMTSLGDSCIVLSHNEGYPLRPTIKDLNTDEVIDLAHDYNSMSIVITEFISD